MAVVAGMLAVLSHARPTGQAMWDDALSFLLAIVVVIASTRSPREIVLVFIAIAAALGSTTVALVGIAGLLAIIMMIAIDIPAPISNAAGSTVATYCMLRWPSFGPFGTPSLVAGLMTLVLLVSAYQRVQTASKRLIRFAVTAPALIVATMLSIGLVQVNSARNDALDAAAFTRSGLLEAREGRLQDSAASFDTATALLERADDALSSGWTHVVRFVPVVSQNRAAASALIVQGQGITRVANTSSAALATLSSRSVDIGSLQALSADLVAAARVIEDATVFAQTFSSDWLLPPVQAALKEFETEALEQLPDVQLAGRALQVLPGMLGGDEARRYFVAFGTPAESRELGGFIGSYALVEVSDGNVRRIASGRVTDLYDITRSNAVKPGTMPDHYLEMNRPSTWPQNLTGSPDVIAVASAARDLLAGFGGTDIDGFVYLDSWAFVDFLKLSGPVDISFRPEPLTAENASTYIFDEQFRRDASRTQVFEELSEVSAAVLDELNSGNLLDLERLQRTMGNAARAGRLQVVTFDSDENDFLQKIGLQRTFAAPQSTSDAFAFVQTNGASSKLDLYLHRQVNYDVVVDDAGALEAVASVTLTSNIPESAPAYVLTSDRANTVLMSLYSPHELVGSTLDGVDVVAQALIESGKNRYLVQVDVPAGGTRTLEFKLQGVVLDPSSYELSIWHQPLVNNDGVRISYQGPAGSTTDGFELTEDTVFEVKDP